MSAEWWQAAQWDEARWIDECNELANMEQNDDANECQQLDRDDIRATDRHNFGGSDWR